MAEEASAAVDGPNEVIDAPVDAGDVPTTEDGGVDVAALRAKAREVLFKAQETEAVETKEPPQPDKPKEEPVAEELDEETKRKKQLEEEGKLSDEKLSRAFAKLHAQEKRHKARIAEDAQARQALEMERQAFAKERETWESERSTRVERAKKEPLTVLKELGWSWDQLVQYVASNGEIPPERQFAEYESRHNAALEAQKAELEKIKKEVEDARNEKLAMGFEAQIRNEVKTALDSKKFERVLKYHNGSFDEVLEATKQTLAGRHKAGHQYVAPEKLLEYAEKHLTELARRLGQDPGQAGAVTSAETPAAVTPISNNATSERSREPARKDSELWSPEDEAEARRRALEHLSAAQR